MYNERISKDYFILPVRKKQSDFMNEMLKLCKVCTCNSVNLACNIVLKVSIENSVSTFLGHRPSNQIL